MMGSKLSFGTKSVCSFPARVRIASINMARRASNAGVVSVASACLRETETATQAKRTAEHDSIRFCGVFQSSSHASWKASSAESLPAKTNTNP